MTNTSGQDPRTIVVGIDGSEASNIALAWAADQAALTDARLEIVAAWGYPLSYGWSPAPLTPGDLDLQARDEVAKNVKRVLGDSPTVEILVTVVEGPPKVVLVKHSTNADLLVVGCRGLGAFRGMLLGSVSSYVASHAHCPVVIVHSHDEPATEHQGHHPSGDRARRESWRAPSPVRAGGPPDGAHEPRLGYAQSWVLRP